MNEITKQALLEINRKFYQVHAASFNASRQRPWQGWNRVVEQHTQDRIPFRVLDLGCGNARLAEFLVHHLHQRLVYVGVDTGTDLLTAAHRRISRLSSRRISGSLVEADATARCLGRHFITQRFDLIALFGVLHHVPGLASRCRLMAQAASLLAPGGVLAISLWQFPRTGKKTLDWERYTQCSELPLALDELEADDYLLTWAGDRHNPRYCHFTGPDEANELICATKLCVADRFMADGKDGASNQYLIFKHES